MQSKRDRKYNSGSQIDPNELSLDCQQLLVLFLAASSPKYWVNALPCIEALGMRQVDGLKKVKELEKKGLLEYRTGSRQPGTPWHGTPSIVLSAEGRELARKCKKNENNTN